MNILPKKSFHVLNKDNVAKVKRDEKEANRKVKESQERSLKAEQEWRLSKLRQRASAGKMEDSSSLSIYDQSKSMVNNKEREIELDKEKMKNEMKLGVLTYLGGSEWNPVSKRSPAPWYTKGEKKSNDKLDDKGRDEARKNVEDPLALMNSILASSETSKMKVGGEETKRKHKQQKHEKGSFEETRRNRIERDSVRKRERNKLGHVIK